MTILESLLERRRQADLDRRRVRNDIILSVIVAVLGAALLVGIGIIL